MSVPIEIVIDKLRAIALSEVNRLMYVHNVFLDRDDALQHATIEGWLQIERGEPAKISWGLVRIVMRRSLINEFVAPYKYKKNAGINVPAILTDDEGNESPNPELIFSPWQDNEDQIAIAQLLARVFTRRYRRQKRSPDRVRAREFAENVRDQPLEHSGPHDKRSRKTSREWDRIQRMKFIASAKRLMHRRYD